MAKRKKRGPNSRGFFGGPDPKKAVMANKFIMPPFSVLDARSQSWIKRKDAWLSLGLKGEVGRTPTDDDKQNVAFRRTLNQHGTPLSDFYAQREAMAKVDPDKAAAMEMPDWLDMERTGVSVFDPVLTELSYRWFCPQGGHILDPFAGGATRGVVAGVLGYQYTGIEVREEQVAVNRIQADDICTDPKPRYIHGDSAKIQNLLTTKDKYDMLFTCPPYYDREVYSSDKQDGSTHDTYKDFLRWYYNLFSGTLKHLKHNRFAVVVVGEIRDEKTGLYHGFVPDTISVFEDCGLRYYNESILVTRIGSLRLRAGHQFSAGRKVGKSHQNVLVFWKGDTKNIVEIIRGTYGEEFGTDVN